VGERRSYPYATLYTAACVPLPCTPHTQLYHMTCHPCQPHNLATLPLPLVLQGFLWGSLTGLAEPLGGLLGYLVLHDQSPLSFAIVFGIVAGERAGLMTISWASRCGTPGCALSAERGSGCQCAACCADIHIPVLCSALLCCAVLCCAPQAGWPHVPITRASAFCSDHYCAVPCCRHDGLRVCQRAPALCLPL